MKREFQIDFVGLTWEDYVTSLKKSKSLSKKYHFEEVGLNKLVLNPILENSIDVFFFIEFTKKSDEILAIVFKSNKIFTFLMYGCFIIGLVSLLNILFSWVEEIGLVLNVVLILLPLFQFVFFYVYFNNRVGRIIPFFRNNESRIV